MRRWVLVLVAAAVLGAAAGDRAHLVRRLLRRHDGALRLVGGDAHKGSVEVFHLGRWGGVCDDEWDVRDAQVVCRQLGFPAAVRATHSAHFGRSRQDIFWMDNLYCNGDEKMLSDCRFDGWGNSDCSSEEAAGVECEAPASDDVEVLTEVPSQKVRLQRIWAGARRRLDVRLAGGRVPEEGRVEVRFAHGKWGPVCGDGWSLLEANVVCRQLGLGFATDAVQSDYFGGDRRAVRLSGVVCHGNETRLDDCSYEDHSDPSCPGPGDNFAGVICVRIMADLVIDHFEIMRSAYLEDRQLYFLQCAMEENCVASAAYRLRAETANWHLDSRRLLRFTARILNAGTAEFRPLIPKHMWEFHLCHMHYHSMEVFATFDITDSKGVKVAEGHKASFCLEDNQCLPGVTPKFACANFGDQGISVNCSDIYRHNIDCQWVDISELDPGLYTFKVAINPEFKVPEMSFENNAAVCSLIYTETFAQVFNCTLQRP